jgi:prepilin-type N-terminal cleavage/methylation domain-containing protein
MGFINKRKINKGFTMLEMLIVIFVFLTGIVGAYGVILNFYTTSVYSSNRFTATYLSQEGIELIKNLRDNNLISGNLWTTGITCAGVCKIDYNDTELSSDADPYTPLKKDANSFYSYEASSSTIFKRKITIIENAVPNYINVSVETEWYKNGVVNGSVKVEDNLYGYWK